MIFRRSHIDFISFEPLKPFVMLMLCIRCCAYVMFILCYVMFMLVLCYVYGMLRFIFYGMFIFILGHVMSCLRYIMFMSFLCHVILCYFMLFSEPNPRFAEMISCSS